MFFFYISFFRFMQLNFEVHKIVDLEDSSLDLIERNKFVMLLLFILQSALKY